MSYREGAEKFYDLLEAKDGAPFYIDLAHVPELKAESCWFTQERPLDGDRVVVRTGHHVTRVEERITTVRLWYELYENWRMLERYLTGGASPRRAK
jgi:hypothetical protein